MYSFGRDLPVFSFFSTCLSFFYLVGLFWLVFLPKDVWEDPRMGVFFFSWTLLPGFRFSLSIFASFFSPQGVCFVLVLSA